jgi:hypothetical protein
MAGKLVAEFIHSNRRPRVLAEADPARCVQSLDAVQKTGGATDAE